VTYLFHVSVLYIVHSSPFLCVCGDDWITRYPGTNDVTGGQEMHRLGARDNMRFCIYLFFLVLR